DVGRNEIVVFNYPAGDTALLGRNPDGSELQGHNYHQYLKNEAFALANYSHAEFEANRESYMAKARKQLLDNNRLKTQRIKTEGWVVRPTDKKENYIKRCVGIPGDTLEIVDGKLIVNNETAYLDENAQFKYQVKFVKGTNIGDTKRRVFKEKFDINSSECRQTDDGNWHIWIAQNKIKEFKEQNFVDSVWVNWKPKGYYNSMDNYQGYMNIFPNDPIVKDWTEDNMGPWYLPKRDDKIELTEFNIAFYRRAIESYEKNKVSIEEDGIYINDELSTHYTFKMNYYWMMGDNRHNSLDCRMWGYVPEDHVVGKAAIIWFSKDNEVDYERIRWERIFQLAH
ncbi:MAG: signal peptidase I, partial [Parvicellaceae bacterium]